jgi:phage tail-like protein
MSNPTPTSRLLKGSPNWPTLRVNGASAGGAGIGLASDSRGPLALGEPHGSLGGLVLPRGMALAADNTLYLLAREDRVIKRLNTNVDPAAFEDLPNLGGRGTSARQFEDLFNIAIAGRYLYVADPGNRRVQVFDRQTLALIHLWGAEDVPSSQGWARGSRNSEHKRARKHRMWRPVDVVAMDDVAYVLDGLHGVVYRHTPGTDKLEEVIAAVRYDMEPVGSRRWTRIALDREGRLYLLDAGPRSSHLKSRRINWARPYGRLFRPRAPRQFHLDIFDTQNGRMTYKESVGDAGSVRDKFDLPVISFFTDRASGLAYFCVPAELADACPRQPKGSPALTLSSPLACKPGSEGLIFDKQGRKVERHLRPDEGPRLFRTGGVWVSEALDSQIYNCQWHRIELELASLPAGTIVEVSTYTAATVAQAPDPLADDCDLNESLDQKRNKGLSAKGLWQKTFAVVGPTQPTGGPPHTCTPEFLVQSMEGQYMWIRVCLRGDGYATPLVRSIRVHFPRQSYLEYLPAIFSFDDGSRRFLERFLSIFQTEWDSLEDKIEMIYGVFDPDSAPLPFLPYLASWMGLPIEKTWTEKQQRRFLKAARGIMGKRGTLEGLRRYLQIYLQNITGLEDLSEEETRANEGYPQIIEGFRERHHLLVSSTNASRIGEGMSTPLWSSSVVQRLQLGVHSREGDVRLSSVADPERDLFHEYAHRFRVFIPSSWLRSADDKRMVLRALESEKPAHTSYELCLVEPRFRVGVQSTVGIDTVVGGYPTARLACACEIADRDPSRPKRNALGYDTLLGGSGSVRHSPDLSPAIQISRSTKLV